MDDLLLFERQIEDLIIVAGDGDHTRRPRNRDQLSTGRHLEGISQGREMTGDLIVGPRRGESSFLAHCILELIKTEVGHPEIDCEIDRDRQYEQRDEATQRAGAATGYHCDWAPSMTSFTIRSIACFLPVASSRSSY